KKFHIPRKTKEKKALFQFVSTESREYEDMKTILTSGYIDSNSSGCFTYSNPRLVHSELLEKEFAEKRREMKADGRTDKELEESYCFLMTNSVKLPVLCEKGLTVGRSKNTVLGNPSKGVYLSRYSDLLQTRPLTPGATGELLILKVMKGKVKSIYENMKILQDPTPRFDSHIAKNASKVTSLSCFRAYELTQQYFYEYLFDELRERPRQVCPFAVVSFHFKGKDAPLSVKPAAPVRYPDPAETRRSVMFTVWTGDVVKNERVLLQISLRSSSTPSLPLRLPEKLDVDSVMMLDEVANLVPSAAFSFNTYRSSKEDGYYCSLLEVIDRNQSSTNVMMLLLQELETKQLVLVNPLTDKGFLFLLSSVQMATPTDSTELINALFVFPEPRDVSTFMSRCSSSQDSLPSSASPMPRLSDFLPALHHSLVKTRANPPANLSAGVELQTREYLSGVTAGSVQPCPMTEYDSVLDEETKPCPPYHRPNTDSYLRSYLANPAAYMLSAARARQAVETLLGPEPAPEKTPRNNGGPTDAAGHNVQKFSKVLCQQSLKTYLENEKCLSLFCHQQVQQLLDQILTCKKNAEAEVRREDGDGLKASKRKMDQKTAERTLKYFKASVETGRADRIPVGGNKTSFASIITSLGLKDVDLREDGSEVTVKFLRQILTWYGDVDSILCVVAAGLINAANQNPSEAIEDVLKESSPFGRLAMKLGLPTNCDIDLRKQEELEVKHHHLCFRNERFRQKSVTKNRIYLDLLEEKRLLENVISANVCNNVIRKCNLPAESKNTRKLGEIPWVLIPITGLSSERYSQRERSLPQDPRFQHLDSATGVTVTTKLPTRSPAPSPERSPPPSYPSPEATPQKLLESQYTLNKDLDSVVDKHLSEFSSDLQLLLQDEGVNYSLPPLPLAPLPPYASLPQFSPYVSFYNPCPPVADYVGSLHDSIVSLLAASEDRKDRSDPAAAAVEIPVDAALANTVSDFVASVRAGKASAGRTAATEQFSDCDPTSGSGSAWGHAAQPQDGPAVRTVLCSAAEEGGETLMDISSVIDRLEPNVLHNLAEILKDIKRKMPQFYVHCPEPDDPVCKEVREYLVSLGNVHQSPADFLHQDNTENGLLVIIKNQDIAGHVHQIPGLMSLKRHSSVVFVGIDSLDDIKNSSCIELFVSGGCIVSDELVLNPDVITHNRLAALLMLLEKHSSPESLWRWKIHCKTHKKLKEQARFRRDAANLLDLLSAYQKRQIVEFLPYHHCDMTNHQSPDLDCLTELQARYTQFRHTVYLTGTAAAHRFPVYSNGGIIVAGMEEIELSFSRLVG
uniref:Uncharacterized protein n=1 Tax=Poecilia formosa TaxID=48698 RepID=A0A096LQ54_POEFO